MQRWFPRYLLLALYYCFSIGVVGRIVNGIFYLMAKGGSPELGLMFHEHLFVRALLVGLIAGLIPWWTSMAAIGIFNQKFEQRLKLLDPDQLKPWVFVYLSPVIVIALLRWTFQWYENCNRYSSVLQTNSPYSFSELFYGFFSTNCSSASDSALFWRDGYGLGCMVHVQLIVIWMIAVGFSLAPAVRNRVLTLFNMDYLVPIDEPSTANIQESSITEKTDTQ